MGFNEVLFRNPLRDIHGKRRRGEMDALAGMARVGRFNRVVVGDSVVVSG
jgi:hypothetical protein